MERTPIHSSDSTSPARFAPPVLSASAVPARARPVTAVTRNACAVVRQLTSEMMLMAGDRALPPRDRRRALCHARQIAMYVCHVALGIALYDIGIAFGRDRSTVGHACHVVEDRRDDPGFDEFVAAIERLACSVFGIAEISARD